MSERNSKGQFAKGNKGKQVGTTSKKTRQWEQIGDYLVNEGSQKFLEIMENSTDKEYVDKFLAILNFFKPKLASTTNINENNNKVSFKFKLDD